ncbi:MerR family transcriptional regulator [Furfurilactobacillus siliginis]|uniref:Heavy metal-responsive transcriptional regulator n=1 Tax=Furfurilactobacillus siliginis TaxID=348151 RepID=A0A0R2L2Y7_9LACO|nr:MerR family transcriptional regulator [Furfurilactobacillus siliginis]KRN96051.1 hypothetical protein IV55_GL001734 [Furfurilactobacillus siliginis]GEK28757.1 heavy metal-responsive transcriptional regulator [Furfurilactobacillus siliginis]
MSFTIHEVANRFNVTYDALRFYEKRGLLIDIKRDANGQRIYSDQNCDDLDKLLHLRRLGATVEEVKEMMVLFREAPQSAAAYETGIQLFDRLDRETDQKIADLQQQKVFLHHKRSVFETQKQQLLAGSESGTKVGK